MTVTKEMWNNIAMQVGLGVGDGELHLCRGGRSTRNMGVMFIESASKTKTRQDVGIFSEDRSIINIVRVHSACGYDPQEKRQAQIEKGWRLYEVVTCRKRCFLNCVCDSS